MSINYSYLSLASIMTFILVGCHWIACIWGLQARAARTQHAPPRPSACVLPACTRHA